MRQVPVKTTNPRPLEVHLVNGRFSYRNRTLDLAWDLSSTKEGTTITYKPSRSPNSA